MDDVDHEYSTLTIERRCVTIGGKPMIDTRSPRPAPVHVRRLDDKKTFWGAALFNAGEESTSDLDKAELPGSTGTGAMRRQGPCPGTTRPTPPE
ncbi:hypothetical protein EGT50_08315 [Rhodococcus xishaensis]|uniref:Uncharacterized protein n=1 Tax=Rhodococcus xishaensis TaxID=2487364 RepID=A0A438AVK7_9NOCA|nr:hypothetical protein EGT50_08315 [Rhodococcus xishaensis]